MSKKRRKKNQRLFNLVSILLSLLICPQKLQYSKNPQPKTWFLGTC